MSKKPRPPLADFGLWEDVAQTVLPLGYKRQAKSSKSTNPGAQSQFNHKPISTPAQAVKRPPSSEPYKAPPLSQFDRRSKQRLLRGQAEIEARIDLHGTGVELGRVHLLQFLISRRKGGARLVLVITGKGQSPFSSAILHGTQVHDAPERLGKLRRALPRWLEEPVFREHVIGYQPAHPRHGGGGAFYVRLRRDN